MHRRRRTGDGAPCDPMPSPVLASNAGRSRRTCPSPSSSSTGTAGRTRSRACPRSKPKPSPTIECTFSRTARRTARPTTFPATWNFSTLATGGGSTSRGGKPPPRTRLAGPSSSRAKTMASQAAATSASTSLWPRVRTGSFSSTTTRIWRRAPSTTCLRPPGVRAPPSLAHGSRTKPGGTPCSTAAGGRACCSAGHASIHRSPKGITGTPATWKGAHCCSAQEPHVRGSLNAASLSNPTLFLYCEDAELSRWVHSRGLGCVMSREARVRHGHSRSSGGAGSPIPYYYLTRNRIRLARGWLDAPQRLLFHAYYLPTRLLLLLGHALRRDWRVFGAVLQGLRDGYRGRGGVWSRHGGHRG